MLICYIPLWLDTVYLPQLRIGICFFQIRTLKGLMAEVVNICCVKLSNTHLLFVSKMMDNLIFWNIFIVFMWFQWNSTWHILTAKTLGHHIQFFFSLLIRWQETVCCKHWIIYFLQVSLLWFVFSFLCQSSNFYDY